MSVAEPRQAFGQTSHSVLALSSRTLTLAMVFLSVGWLAITSFVWVSALLEPSPVFLEPQGSVRSTLGEKWAETGKPVYPLDRFDEVPADMRIALTPRDASLVGRDVVPKDFAYPVVANALALKLGRWGLALLPPVISLLSAIIVGVTARAVTRSTACGSVAMLLTQTSVVWWSATYGGVSFTPANIAFGLSAVAVMITYRDRPVPIIDNRFLVAGLLGGIAGGWHYGTLVWWVALVVAGCIGTSASLPQIARRCAAAGVGGAIGFAPVLIFNSWIYGSATATGYSEFSLILDAVGWQAESVGFSVSSFRENILTYGLRPEIVPIVVASVYGIRSLQSLGIRLRKAQVVVIALGAAALIAVSGGSTLWGTALFQTNASFFRYLAPAYGSVIVLASAGLHSWWKSGNSPLRLAAVLFVLFIVPVNLVGIVQLPGGIIESRNLIASSQAQQLAVLEVVPSDGFVITRRADKLIFPHRSTLVAAYLRTSTPSSDKSLHLYDTFPDAERVAEVAIALSPMSPVYLLNDTGWIDPMGLGVLDQLLHDNGICLTETEVERLFVMSVCKEG